MGLTSLIAFFAVVSALSDWGSTDLQDAIRRALKDPRFNDTGLTVSSMLEWLRRILFGVVVLSIAGMVFAVFAARGHRPSRMYLTVMCGFACLAFLVTGGLFGLLPAAFAMICGFRLWTPESRAWFEVESGEVPVVAVVGASTTLAPESTLPSPASTTGPMARRPKPVLIAGIVTLCAASLIVMFCGYFMVVYLTARSSYIASLSDQPMKRMLASNDLEPAQVAHWLFVGCAVLGPIALLACAAAALLLLGSSYGRGATLALAWLTVPLSLVVFGVGLPWTIAAIVVIIQLRKPESRGWFAKT